MFYLQALQLTSKVSKLKYIRKYTTDYKYTVLILMEMFPYYSIVQLQTTCISISLKLETELKKNINLIEALALKFYNIVKVNSTVVV